MSGPTLHVLTDPGLGNAAYLLELGDGRALAVDVSRDLRAVHATAERHGLEIAFAAETHLHEDFLGGAVELHRRHGTTVLASAAGRRRHPHVPLVDGDEVDLGGLRLRVVATPGHTDDHVAYEILDGGRTVGLFTGGSLMAGAATHIDLRDPSRTEELARAQHRSLQRLAAYDDAVARWPTHGGGSSCHVRHLVEINRSGPAPSPDRPVRPLWLLPAEVVTAQQRGAEVVDVRPVRDFAAAHVPGSLSIPLRPAFATWLGAMVDLDRELVVVRNPGQDLDEIWWQAHKIGADRLVGQVADGLCRWRSEEWPTASVPLIGGGEVGDRAVLDVRQRHEYAAGHVPGSTHAELGALLAARSGPEAWWAEQPTVVVCGDGERAMGAASLLLRAGHRRLAVLDGGPGDWAAATGRPLETGVDAVRAEREPA